MLTSRVGNRVQCPFYRHSESYGKARVHRIICEGIVDRSTLVLNYRYKKDFSLQLGIYCCEHYEKCEIYRMLLEKYQDAA